MDTRLHTAQPHPFREKVKMHRAAKYRIRDCGLKYEDTPMRNFLMGNCGCARKLYNLLVDFLYAELEKRGFVNGPIPDDITFPEVTYFKGMEEYAYLKSADSLALANARLDFLDAVKRYNEKSDHVSYTKRAKRRAESGTEPLTFRGLKGMPKFHSRAKGDVSYTTNCQYPDGKSKLKQPTVRLENGMLHLPKMGRNKGVGLDMHRNLPEGAQIGSVTVSMDTDGELYASVEYSYELEMPMTLRDAVLTKSEADVAELLKCLKILALDYDQQDFYVDSEGRKANYPHYYRKSEEKLAKLQRQLSRMEYDPETHKGSKNYEKKLAQIRKLQAKIRNQRRDFLQKLSTKLAGEYDIIIVEDIDLRAMGGSLSLGKNLHDNGFGMFRDMLAYKLEAKGSVLVKIDRWYPSTKTCSKCGYVNPDVTLGVDEWDCPQCGTHHLRDDNAAVNIKEEGMRVFREYFLAWLEEDAKARVRAEALTAKACSFAVGRPQKQKERNRRAAAEGSVAYQYTNRLHGVHAFGKGRRG